MREHSRINPYELRWLFVSLLGVLGVALGVALVSRLLGFHLWAGGSVATLAITRGLAGRFDRLHPIPQLPGAITVKRDRPRV